MTLELELAFLMIAEKSYINFEIIQVIFNFIKPFIKYIKHFQLNRLERAEIRSSLKFSKFRGVIRNIRQEKIWVRLESFLNRTRTKSAS